MCTSHRWVLWVALTMSASGVSARAGEVAITQEKGQFRVATDAYTATLDQRGCLQSLAVGGTEFLCPATQYTWRGQDVVWPGTACGMSQGGGRPLLLHAPVRRT